VSLTYRATVDAPARFRKSKAVGLITCITSITIVGTGSDIQAPPPSAPC
jgi:hypothetical protein